MFFKVTKRALKNGIIGAFATTMVVAIMLAVSLTLIGQSQTYKPLPIRWAWMAALGEEGWDRAFYGRLKEIDSLQELEAQFGEPDLKYPLKGRLFLKGKAEDGWMYANPKGSGYSGPLVRSYEGQIFHD